MRIKKYVKDNAIFSSMLILEVFIVLYLFYNNLTNSYEQFNISIFTYWAMTIIGACLIYCMSKNEKRSKLAIVLFLFIGIILVLTRRQYSPIDEAAHFDYINYIIKNHKLPTLNGVLDANALSSVFTQNIPGNVMNHEAVQPPLYYLFMALLTFFIKNLTVRLMLIRFIGLGCLIIIYIFTAKTVKLLQKHNYIKSVGKEINLIIFLMIFNPGIIVRFSFISNEHLTALLSNVLIYYILKIILEGLNPKLYWACNIMLGALILTKNTAVFFIGIMILTLIYYKKIKEIIITFGVICLAIFPWFIFNYKIYGALTGIKKHIEFVLPIVNPQKLPIDVINGVSGVFDSYFIQEYPLSGLGLMLAHLIGLFLVSIIIIYLGTVLKNGFVIYKNKMKFLYDENEKNIIVTMLFTLSIVFNIMILVFGTITTKTGIIIGRYMYISSIPVICIILHTFNNWKSKYIRYALIYISLFLSISYTAFAVSEFKQHQGILGKFAPIVETIEFNNTSNMVVNYNDADGKLFDNYIELKNGNVDPQIIIEKIKNIKFSKMILTYDSDTQGVAQVFYANDVSSFNEEISKKEEIEMGENNVTQFMMPVDSNINYIRIDLPNNSIVKLKKIELTR